MRIEKHPLLKHGTQLDSNRMFISFLHDLDQKVESYIETATLLQDPTLLSRLRKARKGKYITLESFAKKHGLK